MIRVANRMKEEQQATGCWLLATGCLQLATGRLQLGTIRKLNLNIA